MLSVSLYTSQYKGILQTSPTGNCFNMRTPAPQWAFLAALLLATSTTGGAQETITVPGGLQSSGECSPNENVKCGQGSICVAATVLGNVIGADNYAELDNDASAGGNCAPTKEFIFNNNAEFDSTKISCRGPIEDEEKDFECKRLPQGQCDSPQDCCYSDEPSCSYTCTNNKCTKKPAEDTSASITPTSTGIVVGAAALASFTL